MRRVASSASSLVLALAVVALLPAPAHAELTHVVLKIYGMDCATCAHGVRVGIQKIDGVDTVELSLEHASADVTLRPGNRVTLDQFRQLVKFNGFTPKDAVITARATAVTQNGRPGLEIAGRGTRLVIADKSTAAAVTRIKALIAAGSATPIAITGTVTQKKDGTDEIVLTSVTEDR